MIEVHRPSRYAGHIMRRVLFICTHNSARSQMAEALLRKLRGAEYDVLSAGTSPTRVHPHVVKVMEEIGIDMSGHRAKAVDELAGRRFDLVVTVCDAAKEACPALQSAGERMHSSFEDPSAFRGTEQQSLAVYRRVRDEIKEWLETRF